jgi:hypothetical protein
MTSPSLTPALDFASRYAVPRWCVNCGGEQTFVPVYEVKAGRVGFCFGCNEEKIVAFTRVNSESAA